ncbi:hypothetical protein HDIA_2864 [Hartmannibacter diazotrophicus]|uniref:Uncharacterized protein n=1 Tax=Hartmannibacter diazotrophicus TaxID=1482074 RepID=A0A2C9D9Y0_9HYPH|nr:hypothetical protein HDIA_2864 [Hartmannibacter diazotrophicus]
MLRPRDPFQSSLLSHSAFQRFLGAAALLALLWLAVLWAVSLP